MVFKGFDPSLNTQSSLIHSEKHILRVGCFGKMETTIQNLATFNISRPTLHWHFTGAINANSSDNSIMSMNDGKISQIYLCAQRELDNAQTSQARPTIDSFVTGIQIEGCYIWNCLLYKKNSFCLLLDQFLKIWISVQNSFRLRQVIGTPFFL
jgi:hypothetical protein